MGATHVISVFLSANAGTFNGVMIAAGRTMNQLDRDMRTTDSTAGKMATTFKNVLAGAAVAVAVGLAAAIGAAMEFEVAMRNVNSISKLSEAELQAVSKAVLDLSRNVPQGPKILAEALYEIASSGFKGADGLTILEASARAASAGMTDAQTAAKGIVAVINAYGLEAKDAEYVSDVLFKTVELGVLSFEELSSQIGDTLGNASAATVEIDELGAAMATITLSGISAAEAATSLNRLIQKLVQPSDALADAFHQLGYESGQQALEQDKLNVVMERLRILSGGNITTLREWFPEIRAARGALALMSADGANYNRVMAEMDSKTEIAGSTQAAFEEQMKATGNQLKVLGNQITAGAIEFGTKLLPVVQEAISGLQTLGQESVPLVRSAIAALKPFFEGLKEAGANLFEILKDLWETVGPLAQVLVGLAVWSLVEFFNTLGQAIGAVTGFLADHEGWVKAVFIAYTGFVAAKALYAGVAALGTAWAETTAKAKMKMAEHLSNLGEFVDQSGGKLRAFARIVGPGLLLAGAFHVATSVAGAINEARQAGEQLREELQKDIKPNDMTSINNSIDATKAKILELREATADSRGWGQAFSSLGRAIVGVDDPILRMVGQLKELESSIPELETQAHNLGAALGRIGDETGLTNADILNLANSLDLDLAAAWARFREDGIVTLDEIGQISGAIANQRDKVADTTPALETYQESLEVVGDAASTAADQLDAFKEAMDAIIGIHISSIEAQIKLENQFADLTALVTANGIEFDINTEKGRDNYSGLLDLANAALGHAEAISRETGSVTAGNEALAISRQRLLDLLLSYGLTTEAAEALLTQMGLTPENLEVLVALNGEEEARAQMEALATQIAENDGLTATMYAKLDMSEYNANWEDMQDLLFLYAHTKPTTTVYVNDEPATIALSTLMAALKMYGNESPEAQALLQYAPAELGFENLQDWVTWWIESDPTAKAYVNSGQAQLEMDLLFVRANQYDQLSPTAKALVDAFGADETINWIEDRLNDLDGRTVTTEVITNYRQSGGQGSPNQIERRSFSKTGRWGDVFEFRMGGFTPAHIQQGQRIKYAEPATGGEAFIPRLGKTERSVAVLQRAAAWYGQKVVPMNYGGIVEMWEDGSYRLASGGTGRVRGSLSDNSPDAQEYVAYRRANGWWPMPTSIEDTPEYERLYDEWLSERARQNNPYVMGGTSAPADRSASGGNYGPVTNYFNYSVHNEINAQIAGEVDINRVAAAVGKKTYQAMELRRDDILARFGGSGRP